MRVLEEWPCGKALFIGSKTWSPSKNISQTRAG